MTRWRRRNMTGDPPQRRHLAAVAAGLLLAGACDARSDLAFFMLVKSSNHAQDVDSGVFDGTPGFTSFASTTYLDLRTRGAAVALVCPVVAPPMDTGKPTGWSRCAGGEPPQRVLRRLAVQGLQN